MTESQVKNEARQIRCRGIIRNYPTVETGLGAKEISYELKQFYRECLLEKVKLLGIRSNDPANPIIDLENGKWHYGKVFIGGAT